MQGRPGPVVLALPEDMLTTPTAASVIPRASPAAAWPAPGALRDLRQLLLAAKRPLVIAGGSGWDAEACAALQRFAENWELPVGCGFRFQDTFDNRHRLYAGDVGIAIHSKLAARVREADLIIALGVRLGEMTTSGYTLLQVPKPAQKLVHVHAGPEELGRVYHAELLLQASMSCAAKALEALAAPNDVPWGEWAAGANLDYQANLVPTPVSPLDLAQVMKTVQALAPADTVYTNGAGNFAGWLHRFVQYPGLQHHGRTQLAPTSGAMGYGVPAAIAASLLHPDRTAINVAGDGDFLMTGQELATATAYGAGRGKGKLVAIVVDNGSYGTIRMHQEREYPARVSGTDLANPDFVQLAQAYGWRGQRIDRTEQFESAFAQAMSADRPTLLHLKLDTDVITSRTTITALREAALKKQRA
jgi:acetolactate synthase-1/2/3 large subunit